MNRYDEFALEEALRIRESSPGSTVDALSVGPERVRKTIRKALEMGADHGIHVIEESGDYLDPAARASLIKAYARDKKYDLILTGVMAEDDMECQVGQILAALLGWPCATSVMHQKIDLDTKSVYVEREIEGGSHEGLTITLPAVLSIQSGINTPRYPSLSNVLRARTQDLETIEGLPAQEDGAVQIITTLNYPDAGATGSFLEGTPADKARELIRLLHERSVL
jgi:electron transfer flavoprotein beta subunit